MGRVLSCAESAPAMNILLVEAPKARRRSTARFIAVNRPEYVVQCVTGVPEALARLEECCFDLMVVDRDMERTQELCGPGPGAGASRPPVLFLGETATDEERAEAARAGAMDQVGRDAAGMEELFRAVDRVSELRNAVGGQAFLLREAYGEGVVGPCSTGGRGPR